MQQSFLCRKHSPTQNVMVAVDFDLRFTYVLASWRALPMMHSFLLMQLTGIMGSQFLKVTKINSPYTVVL